MNIPVEARLSSSTLDVMPRELICALQPFQVPKLYLSEAYEPIHPPNAILDNLPIEKQYVEPSQSSRHRVLILLSALVPSIPTLSQRL